MSNSPPKPGRLSDPKEILNQMQSGSANTPAQPAVAGHQLRVVHPDGDDWDDGLDEPGELPVQVQEVASFLKSSRAELLEREKELREKISKFHTHVASQHAHDLARVKEIRNREDQIRSLQFHLLQMQNDVIDSQLAMEQVIGHFEHVDGDAYLRVALELLRFEVTERFDYICQRWEILHEKLESLYVKEPVRKAA